ncbi:hypothetical protein C4D60_Mb04t23520 [Musa balbisiana]|uniref:Subtilisin-like protease n=1 Tax=Musa balbisiana TaxID=52838 RepID=A0A4S8KE87_MUSBA|nr:hypothetical protein C4D60_Mb04t23520 [Musa balbisiana]
MALRHSSILFLFASFLLSAKFIAVEAQLFIRGPFRLIDGPFSHFADPSDGPDDRGLQRYIIHVRRPEGPLFTIAKEWRNFYVSLLTKANAQFSLQGDDSPVSRILHAYRNVMTGFAAMFTALEVEAMSKLDWFVHAAPAPFHADPVAIGAFGAIEKGIFVSCSAGNSGPGESTLSNEAPWILTVAATSTNRTIRATVKLGDGQEFDGESLYQQPPDFGSKNLPLVWAGDGSKMNASKCRNGSLDGLDVRGKVVLCERGGNSRIDKGKVVQGAGGAGMILMNEQVDGYSTLADAHVLPASHVAYAYGSKIKDYIKSSSNPTAAIVFKGTTMNTSRAPAIPSFSSRGPSKESPGILKPDIAAPGVSILAAWPSTLGQGSQPQPTSHTGAVFNMMSGTSMSCPHVSGVAALLKKAHPGWSPAAMKSAMMTTAYASDNTGQPIVDERLLPAGLFSFGAGQVDPAKALDPGLVYDIDPDDYVPYLCGLGYTDAHVRSVIHSPVSCSLAKRITEVELNYPSILVPLGGNHPTAVVFSRTVTNVGEAHETYSSEIDAPEGVSVRVDPTSLSFTSVNEKKTFKITFESKGGGGSGNAEGQLKWVSGKHVVRSPIAISFK